MHNKALSRVEIKDAAKGEVEAVFSTFGVIDHDGDVTDPGAFEHGAKVLISAYNHQSWQGALPVGKGRIEVGPRGAVLKGTFFMNTTQGRDTFETVKALADEGLGEWSYGFDVEESEDGQHEGKSARVLKKLKVYEVSPVLRGAGVGTQTLAMKSGDDDLVESLRKAIEHVKTYSNKPKPKDDDEKKPKPKDSDSDEEMEDEDEDDEKKPKKPKRDSGKRFSEHAEAVMADLVEFRERVADVLAMRLEKGRGLGDESADLVKQVREELSALDELLQKRPDNSEFKAEFLTSIRDEYLGGYDE